MSFLEFCFIGLCFVVALAMFLISAALLGIMILIVRDQYVRLLNKWGN